LPRGNIFIVDTLRGYERPPGPPPHPSLGRGPAIADPPRADAPGGLHARNVLVESFALAGVEDHALSLIARLGDVGVTPFVWRITWAKGAVSWELIVRGDPSKDALGDRLAGALSVPVPTSSGNAVAIVLDAASLAERRATALQVQRLEGRRIEVISSDGERITEWNVVEHRTDPRGLLRALSERGLWSGPRSHGGEILWPELVRCRRLAIGTGRVSGLLHMGLPLSNILFFLGALDWPDHLGRWLASRGEELEHVSWDVTLELRREADAIVVERSSLHGPF
jgi:hypothetical protein